MSISQTQCKHFAENFLSWTEQAPGSVPGQSQKEGPVLTL